MNLNLNYEPYYNNKFYCMSHFTVVWTNCPPLLFTDKWGNPHSAFFSPLFFLDLDFACCQSFSRHDPLSLYIIIIPYEKVACLHVACLELIRK